MNEKIVLVTGGFGGIGLPIIERLVSKGYFVLASYNTKRECEVNRILEEKKINNRCKSFKLDLRNSTDVLSRINKLIHDYGTIYGLVNNAGVTNDSTFYKMTLEQWQDVINVNLSSLYSVTQPIFKHMCDKRNGRIINISSVNGQKGQFGQANYSAAKAGIIGFTKSIAQEGARKGVLINAIAPGYTSTEMVMSMPSEQLEFIKNLAPKNTLVNPNEIASAVDFLLHEHNASLVGATLSINNGLYMS